MIGWKDIERLECSRGSHSPEGVLFGGLVGAVAFLALHDESWWAVFSIPAGMIAGGIAGASQPIWRAIYCARPTPPEDGDSKP